MWKQQESYTVELNIKSMWIALTKMLYAVGFYILHLFNYGNLVVLYPYFVRFTAL